MKNHLIRVLLATGFMHLFAIGATRAEILEYTSEAAFFSAAPVVSTETFEDFDTPIFFNANTVAFDEVSYTAPGNPDRAIWRVESNSATQSNALGSNQINPNIINFGADAHVEAFGFFLQSGSVFPLPSWIVTVTEVGGNVQQFSIVFTVGNEVLFRGFTSDKGIREVRVTAGPSTPPGGRSNWVYANVARSQIVSPSSATGHPFIRSLGDINDDGIADFALAAAGGPVRVKGLDDRAIGEFAFTSLSGVVDVEVMADVNANGAPELVALGAGPVIVEVRDSLSGEQISVVDFSTGFLPLDLELIADQTGNGIPEIAVLRSGFVEVEVREGMTSSLISTVPFSTYLIARDLEVYPDIDGDGVPELAVLANYERNDRSDKLEIRQLATGEAIRSIYLNRDWQALQHEWIADIDGNGFPEAAILRAQPVDGRFQVIVRDTSPGKGRPGYYIQMDANYPPLRLLTIPDATGNGADEVAVFGRRINGGNQKAQVKDPASAAGERRINAVFFDRNFVGVDITTSPDINGNGAEELVMLGVRPRDGKLRVIVKDTVTSDLIGKINFN